MLIHEKLKQFTFSSSQQAAVNFILENPYCLSNMTIRELAQACYTSSATLMRIAHRLGYEGWDAFKVAFIKEQEYLDSHFVSADPNIPFGAKDSLQSISQRIKDLKISAIEESAKLLDVADLKKAIQILSKAHQIFIPATNNLKPIAKEFAIKLGRIRKPAFACNSHGEIRYNGTLKDPDNCLIVLSYSGETEVQIRLMNLCRENHVPVIAITSIGDSRIAQMADVTLRICTREKLYSKIGWFTTEASFEYILDVLYAGLFRENYDVNLKNKIETARGIEVDRKWSSDVMKENLPSDDRKS